MIKDKAAGILPYMLIASGIAAVLVPYASSLEAARSASEAVSATSAGEEPDGESIAEAMRYNEALASGDMSGCVPYSRQLDADGDGTMAVLEVPRIRAMLPVFHGSSDQVLAAGVGHVEGTALPVGGTGTRCVLAGHTGDGLRVFDDIRLLEEGDRFIIWSAGQPFEYEVFSKETVLPEEASMLAPLPGEDICTLVTCTPYGVNSHRLLVNGRRCAYSPADSSVPADAGVYVNARTAPYAICAVVAASALVTSVLWRRKHRSAGAARKRVI